MVYGPIFPSKPFYQGMTQLPRETEEALIGVAYVPLIEFLRTKTKISGTDTIYSAVQFIAKEFTPREIAKFLETAPKYDDAPPPLNLVSPAPQEAKPVTPVAPKAPKPTGHPQPIINAKVAASKALGGNIAFSRPDKGWRVSFPNGTSAVWTADFFRDSSIEQIEQQMKDHS